MSNLFCRVIQLSLLLLSSELVAQISPDQIRQIDSVFQNWNTREPGGVILVNYEGNTVYNKAFGLADVKRKIPNDPDLKYELASNAKQFTAMCIALLKEQGKLSVEDNLKKYYPDLKITEEIKIKNLIDHTSGIRDASVLAVLSGKVNLKGEVRKKFKTKSYYLECMMRETDLNYAPGTEFAYNNFNYVLLGDIVEKVSGRTLSAFADSAIFKPLAMTNTKFRDDPHIKIKNEAKGYLFNGKKFKRREPVGGIVGDHNLVSTVADIAKWEANFQNNKLGNGDRGLIEKITTSSFLSNGNPTHYGYGLWADQYKGLKQTGHGGDDGRHTSSFILFPDQNMFIILLANSSRSNDTDSKAFKVADIVLKDVVKTETKKSEPVMPITLPEQQLKKMAGVYTRIDDRGLGQLVKISLADSSLHISRSYYFRGLRLTAVAPDSFIAYTQDKRQIKVSFINEDGEKYLIEKLASTPERKYLLQKEIIPPYPHYAGKFNNQSTGANIKIKSKKDRIVARKGIIRIPLIPFEKDIFYGPANDVLLIFKRNDKDEVISFMANAPDFRKVVFLRK